MQDQCIAFNNTVGKGRQLAVFLGSAQVDSTVEDRAFAGEFLVVYMTPEKLDSSSQKLEALHYRRGIGLLAVDEAHCCSAWGHDFRPPYQRIGHNFRSCQGLASIPVMALTATASPTIRVDVIKSLKMHPDCLVLHNSVDRKNLKLKVVSLRAGGWAANLAFLVDSFKAGDKSSTIIYVATTKTVDDIVDWLQPELSQHGGVVMPYHAKLGNAQRTNAHKSFLVGKCHVIVATVAFGMGIDKPDIRRVINYGPPKCLEDYYQQVGRGGRDGKPTQCTLIHSEQELTNFSSDFYTRDKDAAMKALHIEGIEKMRAYVNSSSCRRILLMQHFNETLRDISPCNCDNCCSRQESATFSKDFTVECKVLFSIISSGGSSVRTSWNLFYQFFKSINY